MPEHLVRLGPEGFYAVRGEGGKLRYLHSDPFEDPRAQWQLGRVVAERVSEDVPRLVPVSPGKLIGIGRNYADHAKELDNPIPQEPLFFLKAPSSVIGPATPVVLPTISEQVDFEGEIAVVLKRVVQEADRYQAEQAILGITAACDVTARDLQRKDKRFARAKSFDTFCPIGPGILLDADLSSLRLTTRINGKIRQEGHSRDMIFDIPELIRYVSMHMTLYPGDVILTGTPAGVGPLSPGDVISVELEGLDPLVNPVEARSQYAGTGP